MSDTPLKWWRLHRSHPIRLHNAFTAARNALKIIKSEAEDSTGFYPTRTEIEKAQRRYDNARVLWERGGRPNAKGQVTVRKADNE